ncbi:MAG: CBS domain-containing protein [Solirubrobacteraceae bacterium]
MAAGSDAESTMTVDDAVGLTVGEVMLARPKTLPGDSPVAAARAAFARATVRTVLLADGVRFVGAIERSGLPDDAPDDAPARDFVEAEPLTATPETRMSDAMAMLEGRREPRLIVLDEDGVTLRGLVCANGSGTGFCIRP